MASKKRCCKILPMFLFPIGCCNIHFCNPTVHRQCPGSFVTKSIQEAGIHPVIMYIFDPSISVHLYVQLAMRKRHKCGLTAQNDARKRCLLGAWPKLDLNVKKPSSHWRCQSKFLNRKVCVLDCEFEGRKRMRILKIYKHFNWRNAKI